MKVKEWWKKNKEAATLVLISGVGVAVSGAALIRSGIHARQFGEADQHIRENMRYLADKYTELGNVGHARAVWHGNGGTHMILKDVSVKQLGELGKSIQKFCPDASDIVPTTVELTIPDEIIVH